MIENTVFGTVLESKTNHHNEKNQIEKYYQGKRIEKVKTKKKHVDRMNSITIKNKM